MAEDVPLTPSARSVGAAELGFHSGLDTLSTSSSSIGSVSAEEDDPASAGAGRPCPACGSCDDARRFVWEFLTHDRALHIWLWRASIFYQLLIVMLVVILFIVDNTGWRDTTGVEHVTVTTRGYWVTELILTALWSVEYVLRMWSCVEQERSSDKSVGKRWAARRRLVRQPLMVFDLLSICSLVVDLCIDSNEYRGLSSLRLLTIFRLEREFNLFGPVLLVIQVKGQLLLATLGMAGVVLLIGSVTMFYIESPTNTDFSSVLKSMWWCTTALTTVGYGDIYPKTGAGRALGSVVAFLGIGLFAMPAGIIASGFQEVWNESRRNKRSGHRSGSTTTTRGSTSALPSTELLQRLEAQQAIMATKLDSLQANVAALRAELKTVLSVATN